MKICIKYSSGDWWLSQCKMVSFTCLSHRRVWPQCVSFLFCFLLVIITCLFVVCFSIKHCVTFKHFILWDEFPWTSQVENQKKRCPLHRPSCTDMLMYTITFHTIQTNINVDFFFLNTVVFHWIYMTHWLHRVHIFHKFTNTMLFQLYVTFNHTNWVHNYK